MDYDDSAFYYFGFAMLTCCLVPATWYMVLKPVLFGEETINYRLKSCKCDFCSDRLKKR